MNAPGTWRLEMTKTASELAYERLRQAIVDGEFEPGKRLTELGIAALFGISRTPIREAFFRLERDGLVRSARGWGIEVVDPRQELTDIYHIREALEGRAARLAAERGSDEEIAQIVALAQASADTDPNDVDTRARLNEEFHLAVTAASHAERLRRLVGEYRELFASPRRLRRFTLEETRRAVDDHRLIAQAILRHDPDAAEDAARLHLHHAYGAIVAAAPPAHAVTPPPGAAAPESLPADKPRIGKRKRGPA